MFILPEWNMANIVYYTGLVVLSFLMGFLELQGLMVVKYSKFRGKKGFSSRFGMFIIYFLPLMVFLILGHDLLLKGAVTQRILAAGILFHFSKRVLEALFLHKYSGPLSLMTVFQISTVYSLVTAMAAGTFKMAPPFDPLFCLGCMLFIVSQFFNYYHHRLLADLRADSNEYHIPHGGLFEKVTCPHYFFELTAWLGLALMSHHIGMLVILIFMINYLFARAFKTHRWYLENFPEYPSQRKRIIPFIL